VEGLELITPCLETGSSAPRFDSSALHVTARKNVSPQSGAEENMTVKQFTTIRGWRVVTVFGRNKPLFQAERSKCSRVFLFHVPFVSVAFINWEAL
jgi:hypothetical protein